MKKKKRVQLSFAERQLFASRSVAKVASNSQVVAKRKMAEIER